MNSPLKTETVIKVPPALAGAMDDVVREHARRTGESEEDARRGVEIAVLTQGIRAVKGNLSR